MRTLSLIPAFVLLLSACHGAPPLFDGASLQGWEGRQDLWKVEDGAITCDARRAPLPANAFLVSQKEYADFHFTCEVFLEGVSGFTNAGVQFRSQRVPNSHEMIGYQVDLGPGDWGWGCLYEESRRGMLVQVDPAVKAQAVKPNDWNRLEISCQGPRIRIWLNGRQTVDYTEKQAGIPASGRFGLQIHGGGGTRVRYRGVEVEER